MNKYQYNYFLPIIIIIIIIIKMGIINSQISDGMPKNYSYQHTKDLIT